MDDAAGGHGDAGVVDDVLDRAGELAAVGVDGPELGGGLDGAVEGRAFEGDGGGVLGEVLEGDGLLHGIAAACEGEELEGEVTGAAHAVFGFVEVIACGGGDLWDEACEVEVAEHDHELVVEVVGDAAGEDAEGLEALAAFKFGFEADLLVELFPELAGLCADAVLEGEGPGEKGEEEGEGAAHDPEGVRGGPPGGGGEDLKIVGGAEVDGELGALAELVEVCAVNASDRDGAADAPGCGDRARGGRIEPDGDGAGVGEALGLAEEEKLLRADGDGVAEDAGHLDEAAVVLGD